MPTLVCVPITVHDEAEAIAQAQLAKDKAADLVEFRVDECFTGSGDADEIEQIVRIASRSPLPCIVTCRSAAEGGHYDGDDAARIALYERLGTASGRGEHAPRFLDIEYSAFSRSANLAQKVRLGVDHPAQLREISTSLIVSLHDFQGRPADLIRRVTAMAAESAASVVKVAYRARSLRDNVELLELPALTGRPTIALGMGEFGLLSRVLAPKFGGFLTFASLRPTTTTAPGQPTIDELLHHYRFREISGRTGLYGVVGWPVGHSLSPLFHNSAFAASGHDGVYLPLPIAAGGDAETNYLSFKSTILELIEHPKLRLMGLSVTIPHKENLVRLAREEGWKIQPLAQATGAANTLGIKRKESGGWQCVQVLNTDASAAVESLAAVLGDPQGKRVGVLGAGGVGRTVAFSLAAAGSRVALFNRSPDRAKAAVSELSPRLTHDGGPPGSIEFGDWESLATTAMDAYVNCTPVGMVGGDSPQESPLPVEAMRQSGVAGAVVMDTVYTPLETPLLKAAAAAGWRTVDGLSMFVRQAAAQSALWTGEPTPVNELEALLRRRLVVPERGTAS